VVSQEEGPSGKGSQVRRTQVVFSVAEVSLGSPTVLWGRFRWDMRTWRAHELEGAMMMWRRGVMAASRMGMGRGRRMFPSNYTACTGSNGNYNERTRLLRHISPHATRSSQCHRVPPRFHVHIHFRFQSHQSPSSQCLYRRCRCLWTICIWGESCWPMRDSNRCCTRDVVRGEFGVDWLVKSVEVEYAG